VIATPGRLNDFLESGQVQLLVINQQQQHLSHLYQVDSLRSQHPHTSIDD